MKYLYPFECEKEKYSSPNVLEAYIDGYRREGRRSSYGDNADLTVPRSGGGGGGGGLGDSQIFCSSDLIYSAHFCECKSGDIFNFNCRIHRWIMNERKNGIKTFFSNR